MSWFDTSGLANIAKSALKEAQRTIDKALDIKEDNLAQAPAVTQPADTANPDEDFFGGWGLMQNKPHEIIKQKSEEIVTKSPVKTSTSLWGSFTGSFFDTAAATATGRSVNFKSKDSVDSLDDGVDLIGEPFSSSKLVVTEEPTDADQNSSSISHDAVTENVHSEENKQSETCSENRHQNRLSVASCESTKNSSDSVEIVSSTECTTSPDSDMQCISTSSSGGVGSRPNSESVEVLPLDSLPTSPSSVEVIDNTISILSVTNSSQKDSQFGSGEFVSPPESPADSLLLPTNEQNTPDSVEVIPDDLEDDSISYTSISESTSATTVLENAMGFHLKKNDNVAGHSEPVTKPPSSISNRGAMHLPIVANLIDTQPQSKNNKLDMLHTLMKSNNVIDIPVDDAPSSLDTSDDGFQSDKTLVPNVMESSSDTSTTTDSNTNSFHLKNMLAEAMNESNSNATKSPIVAAVSDVDAMPPRETSPISSGSRSDLVKIGSDQTTSGHTSGDELETTTSSDIEIISSPNGDSSSTQSRHSPAKLMTTSSTQQKNKLETNVVDSLLSKITFNKIKGHTRELSEASSLEDATTTSELARRLSEMSEILESRESKLIDVTRRNAELEELNSYYREQLDGIFKSQVDSVDLNQVTEEYTQRLSALERKFQQAIRDRDMLRKQLDQCKQEAVTRLSKPEIDIMMAEKDETITELREEGEKLSKQQLQHCNIIKKLRGKEKENENTIKRLKEKCEEFTTETDRLKRSVSAKEEVERSQIEAVHQLTEKNKKYDSELTQLKEQLDDVLQKYDTTKKSLDAAKKELIDKNRTSNELHNRQQMVDTLENDKKMLESLNDDLINQLEELRAKLRQSDQEMLKKDQNLRSENGELLRRLEDAERRNEELSQSILDVSKPLVQQMDSQQASYNKKIAALETVEMNLTLKLNDAQNKLQSSKETEIVAKEQCMGLSTKLAAVESQLNECQRENEMLKMDVEKRDTEMMMKEQQLRREIDHLQENLKSSQSAVDRLQLETLGLQEKLESEYQRNVHDKSLVDVKGDDHPSTGTGVVSLPGTRDTSPTLSLGKMSLSESMASSFWPQEDVLDLAQSNRCTNMLEMQLLQTNLKSRDGELQQLQWELKRREHERTLLNGEISSLLARVEVLEEKLTGHETTNKKYQELQQQYDTLCQLYGEKVEETEELKLDLQDVKDMYKSQIDELLNQQKSK